MNITVNGAQFGFVNGELTFQYYSVDISIGSTPSNIGGTIQVTPQQGVSLTSTEQEVIEAAKAYVIKMSSEETPVYPGL